MVNATDFIDGLQEAFIKAREKDEFEFISLLIGYDGGMGDPRILNHLYESESLFQEFSKMVLPDPSNMTSLRIGLLLYCHFFEMNELYRIIGNLLNIINGHQYQIGLFSEVDEDRSIYPSEKIATLKLMAVNSGMESFISLFDQLYYNRLRNSFFHSDYAIVDGEYILVSRKTILIDNIPRNALSIEQFVLPLISNVVTIAISFFELLRKFKGEYTSNKLIQGRFPNWQPIAILGNPEKGLIGFETIYGGSIRLIEMGGKPFLEARNITISRGQTPSPSEVRLKEIVDRNKYVKDDPLLLALEKEIAASNDQKLIKALAIPFFNWGNNIRNQIRNESHPRQQEAISKLAISKYDLALKYNPELAVCVYNRALTLLSLKRLEIEYPVTDQDILYELNRAVSLQPEMPEIYQPIGELLYNIAKTEPAKAKAIEQFISSGEAFEKGASLNPQDSQLTYNTGLVYSKLSNLDTGHSDEYERLARKYFQITIDLDPARIDCPLEFASLLENIAARQKERRIDLLMEANVLVDQVISATPDIPRPHFKKGNNLFFLGFEQPEFQERLFLDSISEFKICVEINNFQDQYSNNLGLVLGYLAAFYLDERSNELLTEAILHLNKALELKPDKAEAYMNRGFCFFQLYKLQKKLSDIEQSITDYKKSASLGITGISYSLMAVYSFTQQKDLALDCLREYVTLDDFNEESLRSDTDMQFLLDLPEAIDIIKSKK